MGRLAGKVALISGGGNGMGAAEARLFASEGAKVAVLDIAFAEVEAVAAEIETAGGEALALRADVSREEDWSVAVESVLARFGAIDVLVNNAGIHPETPFEQIGVDEWDRVQSINLRGVFLGIKTVLPSMKGRRSGSIVNISSIAAILGNGFPHYSASKAGVAALTRVMAVRYGPLGIRVNAILPGAIETNMIRDALEVAAAREQLEASTPLCRVGQPEDVAAAALFLASDEAGFVSGAQLVVDGAFSVTNGGSGLDGLGD